MQTTRALRRSFLAMAACLGILSGAPEARADAESDAKDLFTRGRELRTQGDCATAVQLFRRAYSIYPRGLGSLRNLAECEEQLGRFASARRAWLDLKRALVTMPDDPKYEGWDKDAEEAAARLKEKVASFVVDVYVRSPEGESLANESTGVELFVNGESVGTALVSAPLERDPGLYRIRAQMADAAPVEQVVQLAAGDNPRVTIRLTRNPSTAQVARYDTTDATDAARTRKTIGWIAVGTGAAFLAGGAVTFFLRQSALSDLREGCPDIPTTPQIEYESGPCPGELESTIKRGKVMSTLSPLLAAAGVVGVGAGLTLILTAPSTSRTQGRGISIHPGLGRIDATWRF